MRGWPQIRESQNFVFKWKLKNVTFQKKDNTHKYTLKFLKLFSCHSRYFLYFFLHFTGWVYKCKQHTVMDQNHRIFFFAALFLSHICLPISIIPSHWINMWSLPKPFIWSLWQACCAEQCSLVHFLRDKLVNTLAATKLLWHPVLKSLSRSEINPPGVRKP